MWLEGRVWPGAVREEPLGRARISQVRSAKEMRELFHAITLKPDIF